ncbi:MAG: ABC transporter permease [Lysobacterales bacterium]
MLLRIATASLWNRRLAVGLTLFTVAISVALLLLVERVRVQTRASFASTISGTDLIVGARSGPVQLLLYSVFRIGDASNNIRYSTFEELAAQPQIAWAIPISLGDSHRGFRVMGTTVAYFEHYRHGRAQALNFAEGAPFKALHEAVVGATVATKLGYRVGDSIVVAHGGGNHDVMVHDDQPFRVVGILAATGTPVDRTVHVSLESLEAIHADWQHGVRMPRRGPDRDHDHGHDHDHGQDQDQYKPESITAVFVGLKNRTAALALQRQINNYAGEPLLAIMPAYTLTQLWSLVGVAESALMLISICVVLAGLLGMSTALVTTLNERRREMAILRALGARPWQIARLLLLESTTITALGAMLGALMMVIGMLLAAPWVASQFGLYLAPFAFTSRELALTLAVLAGGLIAGLIPAWLAYRRSLADGLTIQS